MQRNQTRDGPDDIVHAMRAMTAAPRRPAAPSWTACVDAALLVVAGFVVDVPAEVPVVLVARVVVLETNVR